MLLYIITLNETGEDFTSSLLLDGHFKIKSFTKVPEWSLKSWGVVYHSRPDRVYGLIDLRPRSNLAPDQLLLAIQHEVPHKLRSFVTWLAGRIPACEVHQELRQVISRGDMFCLEDRRQKVCHIWQTDKETQKLYLSCFMFALGSICVRMDWSVQTHH